MTVNTNGNKVEVRSDALKSEREILCEIRDSQLRTEELVKGFIENMSKNPMMKMMAGKFGA